MKRAKRRSLVLDREGFIFSLVLDERRLRLRIFRIFTVGCIHLDNIRYIRQRGGQELGRIFWDSVRYPFRFWYWPRPGVKRRVHHSTAFTICTRRRRYVFVRLRPGFHHRLRTAVGAVNTPD